MTTADNLTDVQIRELLNDLTNSYVATVDLREQIRDCIAALSTSTIIVANRTKPEARERIAALINARTA